MEKGSEKGNSGGIDVPSVLLVLDTKRPILSVLQNHGISAFSRRRVSSVACLFKHVICS